MQNPGAPWLSRKISHHPPPAPWWPARSGKAQWVTVGQLPHHQRRQAGCVLALTLFSIFLRIMPREAKEDLPDSIYIRFRTDGSCSTFGVSSHARKSLRNSSPSCCLPFSPIRRKHIVHGFSDAAKNFGFSISLKKTEVLNQPPPRES